MIPQIYVMSAITLLLSLALWGGFIYLFSGRTLRYFWLLVLGLPLSAIANLYIKQQAAIIVGQAAHVQPGLGLAGPEWFVGFKVLLTPLVEEILKISPLLIRPAWKMVTSRASALWVGLVLGVSFALGEAVFIAYAVAQNAQYASIPWYGFTGYLNERLMTCFTHGVMTAVFVIGIKRGGWFIPMGYLAAVSLHFFLNIPVVLYQLQWISVEIVNIIAVVTLCIFAVIFERLRRSVYDANEAENSHEIVYMRR